MAFLSWLESTAYAGWILFGTGWQIMLTLHALGLATVVGTALLIDLRILGWYKPIPYTSLAELLGLAWIGIWINIFSGLSLFTSQATMYVTSVSFLLKISLVILGIINVLYLRKTLKREAATWEATRTVSAGGRRLAMISIVLWTGAVVAGRLIAYV
jgi:hypothetical protein